MSKPILWSVMNYLTATERLFIAVDRGCVRSVHNLITQQAANPYSKGPNGMTALHFAARDGHFEICDYLVTELNDNTKNTASKCEYISNQLLEPLVKIQRLEYIVENKDKKQLDEKNDDGKTALFLATLLGTNSPELVTRQQHSLLAVKYNPIISLLTKAGANITEQDVNNCKIRTNNEGLTMLKSVKTTKNCQQCHTAKTCNKYKL